MIFLLRLGQVVALELAPLALQLDERLTRFVNAELWDVMGARHRGGLQKTGSATRFQLSLRPHRLDWRVRKTLAFSGNYIKWAI